MSAPMSHSAHARALLGLGLPLIGGHLAQFAIGATDSLMLGWHSVEALAAGTLGATAFFVLLLLGSGFAWAAMPLIAAATEQPDPDTQIRRVTRMALWLSALFAATVMPVLFWSEPILRAFGQEPVTARIAGAYLRVAVWGLMPALGVMVFKFYFSALGAARVVLWVTLLAVLVNGLLNWVLIFGHLGLPAMGAPGAALASVLTQAATLVLLAVHAARRYPAHRLMVRFWRPDWPAFARVFRLGWPIGLTNLAEVGLFALAAVMVGWLGTVPLAAHGIAMQLASATFMVHLGLANAATIRAGRAFARHDPVDLRRGAEVAVLLSVGFAALTVALFLFAPEPLLGLYLPASEPRREAILAVGVQLLVMAALFQLMDGLQVIALGLLRGVQDTRVPMVLAGVAYWLVGLPAGYAAGFALGFGAVGVWSGLVLGLAAAAALLMRRFWGAAPGWALPGAPEAAALPA